MRDSFVSEQPSLNSDGIGRQRDRQAEMLVRHGRHCRARLAKCSLTGCRLIVLGSTTLWKSCALAATRLCADDRHWLPTCRSPPTQCVVPV